MDIGPLESLIGYHFRDKSLLEQALTHTSCNLHKGSSQSGERMEFLGDRVLGLAIAHKIFQEYPHEKEGVMAKRFTAMVREETLFQVAQSWSLSQYIRVGEGERNRQGHLLPSALSDACEAILGGIYLDGGWHEVFQVISRFFDPILKNMGDAPEDPKTFLQEWSQGRGFGHPVYEILERSGPDHAPSFTISVTLKNGLTGEGKGHSRRMAEKDAAQGLLSQIKEKFLE